MAEALDSTSGRVKAPPVVGHEPPRFDPITERDEMMGYLDEHGYVVVRDVVGEKLEELKSSLWDYLETLPNVEVKRDDPDTWTSKNGFTPSPKNGIISGFGIGQSDFMWKVRLLPRVRQAFEAIWETDDLLVSFDGANVFRPWRRNRSWLTEGGWWHADQNARLANRQGKVCVQGLVTLMDATEDTGGLCVMPGSQLEHDAFCERSELAKFAGDFVPLDEKDPMMMREKVLICCKAGDMILWDSRLMHCNTPALTALASGETLEDDPENHKDLIRMVGYVCMTPAKLAPQDVIEKRKRAFVQNISTSHWPHAFVGSSEPPWLEPKDPTLIGEDQRRLIGFDRQPTSSCITS